MSHSAEELLEFDRLKEIVSRFTTCAPGRRAIQALAPQQDVPALDAEFALVREAVDYLRAGSRSRLRLARRPRAMARAPCGPGLRAIERGAARCGLAHGNRLRRAPDFQKRSREIIPASRSAAESLADLRHLSTAIRRAILPNGEISDDASPQLKRIRAGISQSREKIQKSLENILRARGEPAGEDYITLRNDRFVIPVRASDRRAVPGVVHGASGTGQTVFVEPLEAIDLNNRLVQFSEDEMAEIARILEEFTERLRADRGPLNAAASRYRSPRFDLCSRAIRPGIRLRHA